MTTHNSAGFVMQFFCNYFLLLELLLLKGISLLYTLHFCTRDLAVFFADWHGKLLGIQAKLQMKGFFVAICIFGLSVEIFWHFRSNPFLR